MRAEKRVWRRTTVGPNGFPGLRVQFDGAGKGIFATVNPVGEQQDIAVFEHLAIVLMPPRIVPVFPFELFGFPVDDRDHVQTTEADHDVAVRYRETRIRMRELV